MCDLVGDFVQVIFSVCYYYVWFLLCVIFTA